MMSGVPDGRCLCTGYTTGACAAAAAKAAAVALLRQEIVERVEVRLPGGQPVSFLISRCVFDADGASCSVIKDAGGDPDVTDGAEIQATVRRDSRPGINIRGGGGVGRVTRLGLEVAVGRPAINPVPRQMIVQAVGEAMAGEPGRRGVTVTIAVPDGAKLARRTLNSRLGITGGISILGTSGVIIPYSVNAYTACLSQALSVAAASGCAEVVLTTGRRSEKFAQKEFDLPQECFVQAGDFIGYSLEECARKGLAKAIVRGMIGKISKLAAGHLYTNVSDSRVDMGLLVGLALDSSVPGAVIAALKEAVTANQLRRLLPAEHVRGFYDRLCRLAAGRCQGHTGGKVEVECIVSDPEGTVLGRAGAEE